MRPDFLFSLLAAAIVSTSAAPAVPFNVETPSLSLLTRFLSNLHPLLEGRLVQTCEDCTPYWTNELGKHWLFFRGIKYFDITESYYKGPLLVQQSTTEAEFPSKLSHQKVLRGKVFEEISEKGPRENLKKFTSFRTRYYRSSTGRESQLWLMGAAKFIASSRQDLNITVDELKHSWGQNSIILHIPGQGGKEAKEEGITILGAHQDSTNLIPFLAAPGADDDGSGTVTLLETLRALLKTGWTPSSDVEFHWYSAEEGGLLGSQEVVRFYTENGIKVKAMLQQDMTAYVKPGTKEQVGLVTDFTNANLNEFIRLLIETYLSIPVANTLLSYAGSDRIYHVLPSLAERMLTSISPPTDASWNKAGVPSAFAIEAEFKDSNTQNIHSTRDTMDLEGFSFSHLMQFVRLSASFVVELAGWEGK